MSRATSKRAARARDWPALLQAIRDEHSQRSPEARAEWERLHFDEDYVAAVQSALERRDPALLLALLDGGVPPPELLLPALAEVIRDALQGRSAGAPAKFTVLDDEAVRATFERLVTGWGWGKTKAAQHIADVRGCDIATVKRSLDRTDFTVQYAVQKDRGLRTRPKE